MATARAELEALLRTRQLDVTLTSSAAWSPADEDRVAATGWPDLDDPLGGGMRRGHLSEIVGERSAGCTTLWLAMAAAATARGEVVALIDTCDRFDPASAEAAGVDLARLLWVRESGQVDRALKAMNLVLQAGGFGLVTFDLSDVRGPALRQFPHTTWMRIARIVEGSVTVALLIGAEHIARSPGGATITLERGSARAAAEWAGNDARNRRLQGLTIKPRVISMRTMSTMGAAAGGTRLRSTAG
jgi:hypothetical protein